MLVHGVTMMFHTYCLKLHFLYCKDQNINAVYGIITVSYKNYMELVHKPKGKTIPLQAWTGTEGSRSLRMPDFKIIGT